MKTATTCHDDAAVSFVFRKISYGAGRTPEMDTVAKPSVTTVIDTDIITNSDVSILDELAGRFIQQAPRYDKNGNLPPQNLVDLRKADLGAGMGQNR
ncbi:hypothetical protein [Komagataeibacter sp. FXV3]|uniref:hypothetical protein n=1 Tax=Komagataeibacter sp. FXV3 TaxID=2608998 RepID=UPI00187B77B2|nr:hypothetical protein [Komagataeibacter sp. FXV3]MBE7728597.1 hypothetical protein [Komagataeibacter sp. FXV3]